VIERTELAPGYSISRLVHGGWQFSEGHRLGGPELDDALEVLVASADLGVTTFDCADIYTGVEELYGRFLRRWRTTSAATPIQVHTKLVPDDSELERVDRRYVERVVDRSLSRLGVERLDLVQYHWWRDEVPGLEETGLWLQELQRAGKVRHVAATNLDAERVRRVEEAGVRLVANQVQYSVLDRRPAGRLDRPQGHDLAGRAEAEPAPYAEGRGPALLCYGALAGGFLTDRWVAASDPGTAASRSQVKYRLIIDEFGGWAPYQALLKELRAIAEEHGVTTAAVALRFVLEQPAVGAVIAGATRLGHMERNAEAFGFPLTAEDHVRIRSHLDRAPGPTGPVFGLERDRAGPHGRIMRYDLSRVVSS